MEYSKALSSHSDIRCPAHPSIGLWLLGRGGGHAFRCINEHFQSFVRFSVRFIASVYVYGDTDAIRRSR